MIALPMKGNYVFGANNQEDWNYLVDVYGPASRYIKSHSHTLDDLKRDYQIAGGGRTYAMSVRDGAFDGHSDVEFYLKDDDYKGWPYLNYSLTKNEVIHTQQHKETEYIEL